MLPRLLLAAGLAAAAPAAEPAAPAHSLRLLCVEAAPQADRLIVLERSPDGWVPRWRLAVSSRFLSDPLACRTRSLALAVDPAPPAAEGPFNGPPLAVTGELAATPFHEFQLPAGPGATVVLIADAAGAAGGRPYRVVVLDSAAARFPAGRILVQNLTAHTVAGMFGGRRAQVGPGRSAIVEPGTDQPAGMAQVTLARQQDDAWQVFCDTRWPAVTDYRRFLLLIPGGEGTIVPFVMPEHPPFR